MDAAVLTPLLDSARRIARGAGEAIGAVAAEDIDVTAKADGSPLTRADVASHEAIMRGLAPLAPAFPILSEEGAVSAAPAAGWETFWCVDPLDGTKEFVAGRPEYTVNIALIHRAAPVLGVILIPVTGVMYYAGRGLGAFKCAADGAAEPIAASRCERPASAVVSRSHGSAETEAYLAKLDITESLQRGSSLKICAVAEGAADIYPRLGPTCLWDTAAGAAIAVEAGCAVVDLAGRTLSYDPAEGIKRAGFLVYPSHLAIDPPAGGKA